MKMIKTISAAVCCVLFLTGCVDQKPTELTSAPPIVSISFDSGVKPPDTTSGASAPSSSENSAASSAQTSSQPEEARLCKACALYCVEDNAVIDGFNVNERIAPASLTKLLTASVALRYVRSDETFTVGTELEMVNEDSSLCFIAPGQVLTMYDLITGLMLPSGNDAAYTIAVSTARKVSGNASMPDKQAVEYFCRLMNEMARELGMNDSHFADPDGWDDPAHYTTVSDLLKIAEYALTVPEIREIVSTPEKYVEFISGENAHWVNGNKLLRSDTDYYCENAIGMKTGATDDAGLCLIAAFVRNGKTYITAVVGSEEDEDRYNVTLQLFNEIA